ncbi:hypothetical protein LAZ67_1006359, partial [Cordylochernes scorpioides]
MTEKIVMKSIGDWLKNMIVENDCCRCPIVDDKHCQIIKELSFFQLCRFVLCVWTFPSFPLCLDHDCLYFVRTVKGPTRCSEVLENSPPLTVPRGYYRFDPRLPQLIARVDEVLQESTRTPTHYNRESTGSLITDKSTQHNITASRQDYHNEGDHNEEGKDCPDRKEPRSKMEEQTNPSNDTAEQTIPKQETTLEEEETSPPQDTSADPLTQIADALSKLLVARSPREIDVSPYDGTFEAQSFFDNFDAQADRTELTYTDRLRKLPCYLQDFNNLQIYQNNDALPTNVYKFTKCKQDLCSTQPRETDMFTTFPSHQSCLHVADSTPIICSPPISPTHDIEISIPSNAAPQLEHCPHELHRILYEFSQVFSTNKYNVPKLNIPPVKINTTTDKIIALRPYRVPLHDQQEIQTQIEQMLQYGIIAPSVSPYASPITLVTKRDQTKRFCIDYRKLNEIIAPDVHPLPLIETILDKLSKAKYYSSVDIASAYWQVEIEPNSRNLLAFVTLDSQYEFCRLPYGFKNSPQIYHRAINQVMQKYKLNFVTHYFDDFIIFSDTLEDHLQHLQQFLTVCQHENIKLNYNKCSFFKTKIDFLGYTVTAGTYAPQTRNLDTINAIKTPNNQKTLQSFLGAVNIYNKFIADYARLRTPRRLYLQIDKYHCAERFFSSQQGDSRPPTSINSCSGVSHLINYYFILPKRLVTFITLTSGGDKLDHPFAAQAIRRSRRIQGLNPLEYSKMQHEGRETPQGEYYFKHIRNPSIFSGEPGQSSEKWLKEYHRVARFNCWDSSMCLANVYFFLSGTAKVWFENVEEQITSWELLETMLSQAFGHHASEKDQVLEKLKARAQGKKESSEAYIQDVLYLCRQINPNMNENEKVAHLVKRVSEEIYRAIVTFEIATTEEFIRWCRKIELSQKKRVNTRLVFDRLPNAAAINPAESESMEDLIRRIVREEIYHALNPEPATLKPSSLDLIIREEVERNLSAISQPVQRSMPRQQYSNRPQIFKQTPRQQFLNQRPPVPNQTSPQRRTDEWRTHLNVPICFHCGRPGHVARYCRDRRRVFEEARNVEALVDSGADYSVISESFRRYLKIPFFAEKGPVLRVANRKHIETLGRCNLKVSIEELEIYFTFVVFSECSHHIILGLDFFRATSAVIDCGRGEIHLKESVNDGLEEDLPTHALEDCFVPARSIKKITVINEDIRGGKDLMIEGSKDLILKKELVIPSSIINFHHARGEIWVTNGTSQNQIIPAGMLVGYLRKIGSSGIYSVDTAEDDKTQSNVKSEDRRQQILSLVDERLNEEQKSMIAECLEKYSEVFDFDRKSFSTTSNVKHKIDTSDSRPIKQRPYRVSPVERRAIQSEVDKMMKMGIVQPSESPWSSPVVLVKKKDGNDDVLDSLTGAKFFSSMDLRTGYWQIEIDEEDREKTAFITPDGLYEFRVMPFGLCNAPATFERMMDKLLAGLKWTICLCYLDDIIVYATSFKEHIERLGKVLRCIQQAGLCINHEKCRFGSSEIKVLGHLVTESGIRPDSDKIEAITNFPTPKTTTEVRSFMGLCSYYRRFVKDFANKAKPLHDLLRNNVKFFWSNEQEQSFQILKSALTTDPVLGHFKEDAETLVHTYASGYGVGAVLTQLVEGKEKPIAYASRTLNAAERNYSTTERECLAVVWAIYKFRPYLFGKHFTVVSDHHSLCWQLISVRQYVAHCRECQRRKGSTERPPGQLVPIPPVSRPFEKIGIDLLGRFPTSNDGNKWTVVATDYLTRYAMTKAIPNGSSEEVGKFIVEDVILKHGAPRELISDRGRTFISHIIRDINNLCGTAHRFTSAYHPQTNGLTERLNKTLGDMLSMYVDVDQRNWDSVLPYETFAYNTAKQETTGFSPFYHVHGRDVETPLDTILTYREEANLEDYVESLVTNAEDARQLARLNILKAQEKDKSRYDKSHRPVQYRTEDLVWVYTPVRKQGLSEKLLKRYFGPYKVVRQLSE